MIETINNAIEEIITEIKEEIKIKFDENSTNMLSLDNFFCEYCTNSMFESGLDDIFQTFDPKEGQVGSYGYYVKDKEISNKIDIGLDYSDIDFDDVNMIVVEFKLISKNNCEVEEDEYYKAEDYFDWIIQVTDIKTL